MKALKKLNKYLFKYKYRLLIGVLFVAVANVFGVIPARIVSYTIDLISEYVSFYKLYGDGDAASARRAVFVYATVAAGGAILLAALLRGVFLFFQRQTIIVVSRLIEFDLKNEIYAHYQTLPQSFYRRNNTGDLMARISEDVSRVRMYIGPAIMYGINLFVLFVLVIGYMLSVNSRLTLLVLLPLPFLSIGIYFVSNVINKQSEQIQRSLSRLSTFVQEAFSGIRVLKSFVREEDSTENFSAESREYRKKSIRLSKINAVFFPLIIALIGLSTILTVYVGGMEVAKGNITVGVIAEFIIYVNMLTWPVASLGWITSLTQRAEASQVRINEFLDQKTDIVSDKNLRTDIKGEITFKDVKFIYPDSGITALDGINFTVAPGETFAVLGTTGSGKSTLANLICRLYDVSEGKILIDGVAIKDYDPGYLRHQIGYVPQDVFLFSETIRNNIAFGSDEVDEEKIMQAAKDADLYDNVIEFPKGFDTIVGERGITLSGGQKQRASIARALVREPKLLILDDCLSAVDTNTENTILNNLQRVMKGRTSLIISHRVSTVKSAQNILVLDEGKPVEQGTHDELLKLNGVYKSLYDKQSDEEEKLLK